MIRHRGMFVMPFIHVKGDLILGHFSVPPNRSSGKGRYRFEILESLLCFLVMDLKFTRSDISDYLGVSERTVQRRMTEYGISARASYSDISDHDLDQCIVSIIDEFPDTGYRRMERFLKSHRLRIQRERKNQGLNEVGRP